jgi:hypothetical protein
MHARRTHLIIGRAVALIGLVVSLAACSGVNGGGDGRLSRDEFVEEANEICAASSAQIAQIGAPSLADPVAVEHAVAQTVSIQEHAYRELRALEGPRRDQPGVKAWLENVEAAIEQMEAVRQGLADGNQAAIDEATQKGASFTADAEEFADAYGLNECSTNDEGQ